MVGTVMMQMMRGRADDGSDYRIGCSGDGLRQFYCPRRKTKTKKSARSSQPPLGQLGRDLVGILAFCALANSAVVWALCVLGISLDQHKHQVWIPPPFALGMIVVDLLTVCLVMHRRGHWSRIVFEVTRLGGH